MSIESLIYLVVWVIAILGIAYAITYALGNAGMPQIVIAGVWLIAALLLLLLLLRQVGGVRIGWLEFDPLAMTMAALVLSLRL